MELVLVRIVSLVVISLVYMLFDLLNKRNIPSVFVYASLAYGLLLTVLYINLASIALSIAIAAAVLGVGYLAYRAGMLGAGDVFEFAVLSLILPFQSVPIIANMPQLGLPFIISLFIGSGMAALVAVPLYYIPRAKRAMAKPLSSVVSKSDILRAMLVGGVYIVFMSFLAIVVGTRLPGIVLMAVVALGSFSVILFERPITYSMVKYLTVKDFEDGDIIAWNLMPQSQISRIKRKVRGFNRLITKRIVEQMKKKIPREKVPVYKNAIPLAAPIFIGTVLSILLGNLILLLLPL